MAETQLHPFDAESSYVVTNTMPTPPSPLTPGSITFQEASKNKESAAPVDSSNTGTTSILRNRSESKQPIAASSSNANVLPQSNVNTNSNASSTGATRSSLTRRISGPGGRYQTDEDENETPRWTTRVSNFLCKLYSEYSPSLTLENKGSIARDHLANERTYLAWLRTSLSLITVGVAVTQLFRLQTSGPDHANQLIRVSDMGRPLGGAFIALGLLFLWLGTSRYFHNQSVLSYGQFPASRGSVILATITILAILLACFVIVLLQGKSA
ncbi:hypothetical protein BG015_007463 [Linnemannia schmuckeri]|uniref:DUF202 domain-containing protein n=1 Tax=Linnemannia schmuckeri TaxID=64567 RepID=A0A9P5VF75_9FUNG|nr:hypothetical protein BG015_007463 [Linnemannia schmuckeri]